MPALLDRRSLTLVAVVGLSLSVGALALVVNKAPSDARPAQNVQPGDEGIDGVVLLNSSGEQVRWGELTGRPRAVFFGFTNCPVICPVTVWQLINALDRVGDIAQDAEVNFVTIDPERDTPERLRAYFGGFGNRVRAFSGEPKAIARIARAFDVTYHRMEGPNGTYAMDHTSTVFLVDRSGHVVDVIAYDSPKDVIETRLRALVR